jgi:ferredoxin--NADP+ reductase
MSSNPASDGARVYTATLVRSQRITPEASPEEVRHLLFRTSDPAFMCGTGQTIRVMAPGQFGNKYHARFYSIADPEVESEEGTEFTLCVRRCSYIDDFSGEEYKGVASNFLCDLRPGDAMQFAGPSGLAFPVPEDRTAGLLMIGMGTGIAPFRALIRHIYEKLGGWQGKVRLFYGARSGLEMLYMNDENHDLANYYDERTFKAFQAVSPRPAFDVPVALDQAIEQHASEVLALLEASNTHVFIAGVEGMLPMVEKGMGRIMGGVDAWRGKQQDLVASDRYHEVLY